MLRLHRSKVLVRLENATRRPSAVAATEGLDSFAEPKVTLWVRIALKRPSSHSAQRFEACEGFGGCEKNIRFPDHDWNCASTGSSWLTRMRAPVARASPPSTGVTHKSKDSGFLASAKPTKAR